MSENYGGYILETIVVSSWNSEAMLNAWWKAKELIGERFVTPIYLATCNGFETFFIVPEGSREGWEDHINYCDKRKQLMEWLKKHEYEDGSNVYYYFKARYDSQSVEEIER